MTVDLEQVIGFAVQVGILIGLVATAYLGIRKWVSGIAGATKKTAHLLETSNGRTIGELVEESAHRLDELAGFARDNRTLIEQVSTRLDAHIAGHP